MSHSASWHLDGELLVPSIRIGVMDISYGSMVACYEVRVGPQAHVVWAIDEVAAEAYYYAKAAREHYSGDPNKVITVQVNVSGFLMRTDDDKTSLFARHYSWHTSKRVRETADRALAMLKSRQITWPEQNVLSIPRIPLPQQRGYD